MPKDSRNYVTIDEHILTNAKMDHARSTEHIALVFVGILMAKQTRRDGLVEIGPLIDVASGGLTRLRYESGRQARISVTARRVFNEAVGDLVRHGMWHTVGHECVRCQQPPNEGWIVVHDFLEHQESVAEQEERHRKRVEAGRLGGLERVRREREKSSNRLSTSQASAQANAKASAQGVGQAKSKQSREEDPVETSADHRKSVTRELDDDEEIRFNVRELDDICGLTGGDRRWAAKVARLILGNATVRPSNPIAYVLAAVKNDPENFRYRRGNPTRAQECPEHMGEWADNCRYAYEHVRPGSNGHREPVDLGSVAAEWEPPF